MMLSFYFLRSEDYLWVLISGLGKYDGSKMTVIINLLDCISVKLRLNITVYLYIIDMF